MWRTVVLLSCLMQWACGAHAQMTFEMTDRGVVSFSDEAPLARAVVNMHGPDWAGRSIEQAEDARRDGDRVEGAVGLGPARCEGTLDYTVRAEAEADGARLDYTLEFSAVNDIFGAYVSFLLPCARFEGREAALLPTGVRRALPTREGQGFSAGASAFTVDLGEGRRLVIAGDAAAQILVQDNRQFGSESYEARFHLFGRGKVAPGMVARRSFKVAVVPAEQVDRVVQEMSPKLALDAGRPFALLRDRGEVSIGTRDNRMVNVALSIHGVGWSYASQRDAEAQMSGDSRTAFVSGVVPVPGTEGRMEFLQTAAATEEGALELRYRLQFPEAVRLNGYQVSFNLDLEDYIGAGVRLETAEWGREVTIPQGLEERFLHSGAVTRVAVAPDRPHGFTLEVDRPSELLIQDNRGWGGSDIELRFNFRRQEAGEEVPAGETVERRFTFRLNSPLQVVLSESAAVSETDTSDWIPYTLPWDSAPVDVSFLNHKPAGRHGFVTVRDGKFVLEDTGEEIRFWGTCFSAGANFPTHEQSELIARRLARFGINMARTHHADAPWSEMHFFPKDADNTRVFDAEALDRFDYLIHCLKQEGIYIYLDQLVNRYFKPGDEVDAVEGLGACGKPYSNFDPRLIELQKEFSRNLWSHVNPYTGLAYKDDPAIAMMEFANENDLFTQQVTLEPYRTRFEEMYRAWAEEEGVTLPEGPINFQAKTDEMMRFLVEVQRNYYLEMERYLRDEVGVRVPMTGSNWSRNAALLASLRDMQFTDSHTYWHHPARDGSVGNSPMIASRGTVFGGLAFQRMVGKPFFVSEWDQPWPNEWRAELPVWLAAISAFQEWNGLTVYTYRHSSRVPIEHISGAFETFNDPARFGLFANAALLFRRGDVAPARERVAVHIPEEQAVSARSPSPWGAPAFRALAEMHRLDTALFDMPEGYDRVVDVLEEADAPDDIREADTGEIWRSIRERIGRIDSERTQVVFGFLGEAGEQRTADLTLTCESEFATIALSALDEAPIREAERLLLTAVGRAENSGFRYNFTRTKRLTDGTGPVLIDPIRAEISLRTERGDLRVWAIGADGARLGEVASRHEGGRLVFGIGPEARTMYYELAAE